MRARAEIARALGVSSADALRFTAVGGGDINDAYRAELPDGRAVFVKTNEDADPSMFAREAEGLAWLAEAGALRVPNVVAVGASFLVLELIQRGARARDFDEQLGRGLAALHRAGADGFGWREDNSSGALRIQRSRTQACGADCAPPARARPRFGAPCANFIGTLPQDNTREADWPTFYARRRLAPQLELAERRGRADGAMRRGFDRLFDRLPELVGTAEPPARLHGDLWSGNCFVAEDGAPVLIDPAVYGGHREIDLAMMQLFGGFSERTFAAYDEAFPLAAGFRERVPLYQLYPLMVHVNLFGGGYAESVTRTLARY